MTRTSAGRDADGIRRTVLVTGASTGIGRKIAEWLAAEGHFVYAGARKRSDLQALANIENVTALRLDVISSHDIAAAVEKVAGDGRGLDGLVNNAGLHAYERNALIKMLDEALPQARTRTSSPGTNGAVRAGICIHVEDG